MAKKKKVVRRKTGAKRRSSSSKSMGGFVNIMKLGGMAGVAFAKPKIDAMDFMQKLDPKLKAALYVVGGEYIQNMPQAKSMVKDESLLRGAGDALIYEGVKELMTSFGIAGIDEHQQVLSGDDELAIAIEGLDDDISDVNGDEIDSVNGDDDDDDLLSGDDDDIADVNGEIDSVNGDDDDLM